MTQNLHIQKTVQNYFLRLKYNKLEVVSASFQWCLQYFLCLFFLLHWSTRKRAAGKSWPTPCSFAVWPQEGEMAPRIYVVQTMDARAPTHATSDKGGKQFGIVPLHSTSHLSHFQIMWFNLPKSSKNGLVVHFTQVCCKSIVLLYLQYLFLFKTTIWNQKVGFLVNTVRTLVVRTGLLWFV